MNTLQVYKALTEAAGDFNRLAVKLREDEITKTAAEEEAREKIKALAEKFE